MSFNGWTAFLKVFVKLLQIINSTIGAPIISIRNQNMLFNITIHQSYVAKIDVYASYAEIATSLKCGFFSVYGFYLNVCIYVVGIYEHDGNDFSSIHFLTILTLNHAYLIWTNTMTIWLSSNFKFYSISKYPIVQHHTYIVSISVSGLKNKSLVFAIDACNKQKLTAVSTYLQFKFFTIFFLFIYFFLLAFYMV